MIIPLGKCLLLKPEIQSKKICVFLFSEKTSLFEVLDIGEQVTKVQIGDKIYINTSQSTEINSIHGHFFLIEEKNILAKLSK